MNTTELIEIAREYCFSRQVVSDETVLITFRSEQLKQFAQRIEQPLQQQIEQLREALHKLINAQGVGQADKWEEAMELSFKALEQTK